MRKKSAAILLSACLATSLAAPVSAARFSDTDIPWMKSSIDSMVSIGAVTGYPDGKFRPDLRISREEFVTMVNKAFKLTATDESVDFTDVPSSLWSHSQIAAAKKAGYVSGYPDNTFRPSSLVTRAEAAAMLGKLLDLKAENPSKSFTDAVTVPHWSRTSVNGLTAKGIMNGYADRTFGPAKYMTRAEAAVMLNKARTFKPASSGQQPTQTTKPGQTSSSGQSSQPTKTQPTKPQPAPGTVRGKVTLDEKSATPFTVKAIKSGSFEPERESSGDTNGNYTLDPAPGTYTIVAIKDRYVAYETNVKVTSSTSQEVNLKLKRGIEVSGTLLNQYGNPVRNAKIAFTASNVTFTGKTDSQGYYRLTVLPNQTYAMRMFDSSNSSKGFQQIQSGIKVENRDTPLTNMGVGLPKAQVQAKDSPLLGYKEVTVTLSGQTSPAQFRVKVENQPLIYSPDKKKFFGVIKSTLDAKDMYVSIEAKD